MRRAEGGVTNPLDEAAPGKVRFKGLPQAERLRTTPRGSPLGDHGGSSRAEDLEFHAFRVEGSEGCPALCGVVGCGARRVAKEWPPSSKEPARQLLLLGHGFVAGCGLVSVWNATRGGVVTTSESVSVPRVQSPAQLLSVQGTKALGGATFLCSRGRSRAGPRGDI